MRRVIAAFDKILTLIVSVLVSIVLVSMVGLSFSQVVLRNIFDSGIPWADVILRHMVLWICMLGGVLATRQGRQISIDILTRISGDKVKTVLYWVGSLFTLAVLFFLMRASSEFVMGEREFGSKLYGIIPAWYAQIIIPAGFLLIALQVVLNIALGRTNRLEIQENVVEEETDLNTEEDSSDEEDEVPGEVEEEEPETEEDEETGDNENEERNDR